MSISKGGQSVKPYVGGKEVQEAYVGSQLVYRAVPPIYYGFLGTETDYDKADWVTLSANYAAIEKDKGIYRIALTSPGYGKITLNQILGTSIKFTYRSKGASGNESGFVDFYNGSTRLSRQYIKTKNSDDYFPNSYEVPQNTTKIEIYPATYLKMTGFIDQLRYENE